MVTANQLTLSELNINQDSADNFHALGFGNRQQAVLKAKTLGLLPDGLEVAL